MIYKCKSPSLKSGLHESTCRNWLQRRSSICCYRWRPTTDNATQRKVISHLYWPQMFAYASEKSFRLPVHISQVHLSRQAHSLYHLTKQVSFVCKGQYEAHPRKMSGHHQRPCKKEVSSFYKRPSGSFDLAGLAKNCHSITVEREEAVRNYPYHTSAPSHHPVSHHSHEVENTGLTWEEEEEDLGLEEATAPEDWVIMHWYARVGEIRAVTFLQLTDVTLRKTRWMLQTSTLHMPWLFPVEHNSSVAHIWSTGFSWYSMTRVLNWFATSQQTIYIFCQEN